MLVARTPPPTSPGHHDFTSRDYHSLNSSRNHPTSSAPTPPRPSVARRPSALRNASSDHLITPAVTRFASGQPASIPPVATGVSPGSEAKDPTRSSASSAQAVLRPSPARAGSSSSSLSGGAKPAASGPATDAPSPSSSSTNPSPPPPVRPSLNPLATGSDSGGAPSSSSSGGSLLARRRSSRSAARVDVAPLLADLSLRGAIPSPSLAELDDEVHPTVIGESSHAMTPASEASSPVVSRAPGSFSAMDEAATKKVVESDFRPTRDFVSTPFPGKRPAWIDEEDELDSPVRGSTPQRDAIVGLRRAAEHDKGEAQ